ncbi:MULTISPECIES: LAGLIDADG family homing endonuclease [Halobacterium]|uniref:LAGLIDADG family homing endonuclease n=1 Tax=Halobacterium TaxID=2239 RepID=UPI00073E8739|nr:MULTISPECIES: LAGLIDADG family homing endonuclease [Halobacterium]MCG1004278.1 ATPase [Halobacterium noricense]
MAQAANQELVDRFEEFYRRYYSDDVAELARKYPRESKSLHLDWRDLYQMDPDLADDYINHPDDLREAAEEALRLYDLPVDVSLGQAHVRVQNLDEHTEIRAIRAEHLNTLVSVQGMVRKATDVRPKIERAVFVCQRCGAETEVPQGDAGFQEPYQCESCERQGPFKLDPERSEFVDSQKLRIQESPEGLAGGETPQSIDVHVTDDITGEVTPGDHVTVAGVLRLDQSEGSNESPVFDLYMEGTSVVIEDEEFDEMNITEEDKQQIVEISNRENIYEQMVDSMAPSIYGHREAKLAMILQLFSGVTKHLPDESRIRGDLHMLLIGDPGTGKCLDGDTNVTLADGTERPIRDIVEENLENPKPVDDGVYDDADLPVLSMDADGTLTERRATRVWKREAPDQMYRIRTSSGRELEVTPSHPLFVRRGRGPKAVRAENLEKGEAVAADSKRFQTEQIVTDGGRVVERPNDKIGASLPTVDWDRIESIEAVEPAEEWVYDIEVEGTHAYVSNGVVSHNSALISYVQNIAPRSVYTSGKGSSSAGLTAAAVRDDFGDGQQWTLEAGALVLADQGVAAVDELDKMRCVTGDTLVHFDDRVSRIRDFAVDAAESGDLEELPNGRTIRGVEADVWTMTESGRIEKRPVTAVHEYDAPSELVEVTLESGERLTATADHPFFTFENGERVEQPAEELSDDDWVYVPRSLSGATADGGSVTEASVPPSVSSGADGIEPEFAAVLGYLAGDGNLYYDRSEGVYGIRFTNAEEQLLADFEDAARSTFDTEPTRPPSEQRADGVDTVRVHGREHADRVLDAGMNRETYDGKTLPDDVTASSRTAKAAFVRALADSEGAVGDRQLRIHSASYELLLGVKHLLLEFGVSSQLHHREHEDKRDIYQLAITDADSLAAFDQCVGFTLDRKQDALEDAVERVSGERTIRDVVPGIGGRLEAARKSLRLHQSECGIDDVTYCNFENGDANVSIRLARDVLDAFESRRRAADRDGQQVTDADWRTLKRLRDRYHVSQDELATGTAFSQQQISRLWGEDERLLTTVRSRLREVVEGAAETELTGLREIVYGDVKWRRVASVESVSPDEQDDRIPVLRGELADSLGVPEDEAVEVADELLAREPSVDSWSALRTALSRHGIAHEALAADLGVNQSTVTRWLNEDVETDRFVEVADAALDRIHEVRSEVDRLRSEIERREQPKVYDLTVAGTHNFVANGMVVHNSEDRSAMHEALEQQKISISKAGINATLKARCSLLGAANPKYGRFDQYEPIGEQIDLEPALISRFDLIFTVTDEPDPEEDAQLAQHILQTNYAGELNTQQEQLASANHTEDEVSAETDNVAPAIDASLLRKYIAYSRRNCYPTMTDEARDAIEEFYVDLRAEGQGEDSPVPVTARQLEALVRLGEASARVRLSDTVEKEDAERVIEIVRSCLQDIGVDPETGEYDADVVETGRSKTQRDRVKNVKAIIKEIEDEFDEGAPVEEVLDRAEEVGMDASKAEHEIEKLKEKGELYQPNKDHLRAI